MVSSAARNELRRQYRTAMEGRNYATLTVGKPASCVPKALDTEVSVLDSPLFASGGCNANGSGCDLSVSGIRAAVSSLRQQAVLSSLELRRGVFDGVIL